MLKSQTSAIKHRRRHGASKISDETRQCSVRRAQLLNLIKKKSWAGGHVIDVMSISVKARASMSKCNCVVEATNFGLQLLIFKLVLSQSVSTGREMSVFSTGTNLGSVSTRGHSTRCCEQRHSPEGGRSLAGGVPMSACPTTAPNTLAIHCTASSDSVKSKLCNEIKTCVNIVMHHICAWHDDLSNVRR